ncbi:MAG: tetratricopeptide repeat protein [Verrucomicrobiia bacterium]
MTIPPRVGKRELKAQQDLLAVVDGEGVGSSPMKRFPGAVFKYISSLLSTRAAAPKNAAVPGKFLEYKAKAEKGDAEAQFNLGFCYDDGRGVAKNAKEAVKWYRKAAEQNYAPAQFNLGYCYANGQGIRKDKEEAVKWFRLAAEQNYAPAQSNLGYCYDNGRGVEKDAEEATKWYRKAAEQGHPEAQLNLGYCYANGQGVEKDIVEAYAWFSIAAKADPDAAESRDLLRKGLTPQQFTDVQKRTKRLRLQIKPRPSAP